MGISLIFSLFLISSASVNFLELVWAYTVHISVGLEWLSQLLHLAPIYRLANSVKGHILF